MKPALTAALVDGSAMVCDKPPLSARPDSVGSVTIPWQVPPSMEASRKSGTSKQSPLALPWTIEFTSQWTPLRPKPSLPATVMFVARANPFSIQIPPQLLVLPTQPMPLSWKVSLTNSAPA